MNTRILKTFIFILISLAFLSTSIFAQIVGKVIEKIGRVDVLHKGSNFAVPVKKGEKVLEGDIFRAKSKSKATIKFLNNNILKILPKTRIKIKRCYFGDNENNIQTHLYRGKVEAKSAKHFLKKIGHAIEKNVFEVHTPVAVAGIKGTHFIVFHINNISGVLFLEGNGYVYNPKVPESVKPIKAGQISFVSNPNQPPTSPRKATKAELKQILKSLKEEKGEQEQGEGDKKEKQVEAKKENKENKEGEGGAENGAQEGAQGKQQVALEGEQSGSNQQEGDEDIELSALMHESMEHAGVNLDNQEESENIRVTTEQGGEKQDKDKQEDVANQEKGDVTVEIDKKEKEQEQEQQTLDNLVSEYIEKNLPKPTEEPAEERRINTAYAKVKTPEKVNNIKGEIQFFNNDIVSTASTSNYKSGLWDIKYEYSGEINENSAIALGGNFEDNSYWILEENNFDKLEEANAYKGSSDLFFISKEITGLGKGDVVSYKKYVSDKGGFKCFKNIASGNLNNENNIGILSIFSMKSDIKEYSLDYTLPDNFKNFSIGKYFFAGAGEKLLSFIKEPLELNLNNLDSKFLSLNYILNDNKLIKGFTIGYLGEKLDNGYTIYSVLGPFQGSLYSDINMWKIDKSLLYSKDIGTIENFPNKFERQTLSLNFNEFNLDINQWNLNPEFGLITGILKNFNEGAYLFSKDNQYLFLSSINNEVTGFYITPEYFGNIFKIPDTDSFSGFYSRPIFSFSVTGKDLKGGFIYNGKLYGLGELSESWYYLFNIHPNNKINNTYTTYNNGSFRGYLAFSYLGNILKGYIYTLYIDDNGNIGIMKGSDITGNFYPQNFFSIQDSPLTFNKFYNANIEAQDFFKNIEYAFTPIENYSISSNVILKLFEAKKIKNDNSIGIFKEMTDGNIISSLATTGRAFYNINKQLINEKKTQLKYNGDYLKGNSYIAMAITSTDNSYTVIGYGNSFGKIGDANNNDAIPSELPSPHYPWNENNDKYKELWQDISKLQGTEGISEQSFKLITVGAYIETTKFLELASQANNNPEIKTRLKNLNIPCIQVGKIDKLTGSNDYFDVNVENVVFFAHKPKETPVIWASKKVYGNFKGPASASPELAVNRIAQIYDSNTNSKAYFTFKNINNGQWNAQITHGKANLNSENYKGQVSFTGVAAGDYKNDGSFNGTASGITK